MASATRATAKINGEQCKLPRWVNSQPRSAEISDNNATKKAHKMYLHVSQDSLPKLHTLGQLTQQQELIREKQRANYTYSVQILVQKPESAPLAHEARMKALRKQREEDNKRCNPPSTDKTSISHHVSCLACSTLAQHNNQLPALATSKSQTTLSYRTCMIISK